MHSGVLSPGLEEFCNCLGDLPVEGNQLLGDLPKQWDAYRQSDWDRLIQSSRKEYLAPLLYWLLNNSGRIESLPELCRGMLRDQYSTTWLQNQLIFTELARLARLLSHASIPLVVLKGACLAATIYPDPGLRPMDDLDILVMTKDYEKASEIAFSIGYKDVEPEASHGAHDVLKHHISLIREDEKSPMRLEIHRSLSGNESYYYGAEVGWFWTQVDVLHSPSSILKEIDLQVLSPTAQILYASGHAILQHGGRNAPLIWYFDIDRLIRSNPSKVDWDLLFNQAVIFEWGTALYAALTSSRNLFHTPIPDSLIRNLGTQEDRNASLVKVKAEKQATHLMEEILKLRSLHMKGKIVLLKGLILPNIKYMRWRYGFHSLWLLPVFYLVRWWDIFRDCLRTLRYFITTK
jgi:hypothetical protein